MPVKPLSPWREVMCNRARMFFGCTAPDGLAHKIYEKIAGSLYCMCCIFWRGLIIGIAITIIMVSFSLLFFFMLR